MMHDVPNVKDYGKAIDTCERRLAEERAKRDAAMTKVEASRRGEVPLSRDEYSDQKAIYGNAQYEVERFKAYLRCYGSCHRGELSLAWIGEQWEVRATKVTAKQIWQRWRDLLAGRAKCYELSAVVPQPAKQFFEDDFGEDKFETYVGSIRERIEAEVARNRAAGLYDIVCRGYHGQAPRSHQETLNINSLVKRPRVAPPTSGKRKTSSPTRSTYIGA
jgi:hypothetical protein